MDSDLSKCVGNDNRYSFWCEFHEQRRFYGVCLWLKDAYEKGRISAADPLCDCARAMEESKCTALKMRREEEEKAEVLFYTERTETNNTESEDKLRKSFGYKIGWNKVGTEIGKESGNMKLPYSGKVSHKQKEKPNKSEIEVMDFSISSTINEQIEAEKELKSKREELRELKGKILSAMKTDRILAKSLLEKAKELERRINGNL